MKELEIKIKPDGSLTMENCEWLNCMEIEDLIDNVLYEMDIIE